MKIGITFPVIGKLEYTQAAIASIVSEHDIYIVIVDNGAGQETREWWTDVSEIKHRGAYITNGGNVGLTIAWNQGVAKMKEEGCDYYILANNDIILHPATIDNLVTGLDIHPEWGMLTAVNDRGWADANGGPQSIINKPITDDWNASPHPDFSFFMLRPSTIDKVGLFDEEYSRRGKAFYEDNNFHRRMDDAGVWAMCTTRAPYYHYGSVTANSINASSHINRQLYIEQFGQSPEEWQPKLR